MGSMDRGHVQYSDSHAFNKGLGWRRLFLDASPFTFEQLPKNHSNELDLVHARICSRAKDLHWVEARMAATRSFVEFATDLHKQT
jgi:hypothetical protein